MTWHHWRGPLRLHALPRAIRVAGLQRRTTLARQAQVSVSHLTRLQFVGNTAAVVCFVSPQFWRLVKHSLAMRKEPDMMGNSISCSFRPTRLGGRLVPRLAVAVLASVPL